MEQSRILKKLAPWGIGAGICGLGVMFAALVYAATDEGKTLPLVGPCASRVASDDVYQSLALDLIYPKTGGGLTSYDATPERVAEAHARYAQLRQSFLPSVSDTCLRAHVSDWLDYYDEHADSAARDRQRSPAERDDYAARQSREKDQVRALAERLGVKK